MSLFPPFGATATAPGSPSAGDLDTRLASVESRIGPSVRSVVEFGAIGDGLSHPLSQKFTTLAAAQVTYPHATALSDEIDWAAWQGTVDAIESLPRGGMVYAPAGVYRTNRPITVEKDNIQIAGDGEGSPTGGDGVTAAYYGGTVIQPTAAYSGTNYLKVGLPGTPTRTLRGVHIRDISIDGANDPGSTANGIFFQVYLGGMMNVQVVRAPGYQIVVDGNGSTTFPNGSWDCHFWAVTAQGLSRGKGWLFSNFATDHTLVGCTAKFSTSHGFEFDAVSSGNMLMAPYAYNNAGHGIHSGNCHHQRFVDIRVQDCNGGVFMTGGGDGGFVISGEIRNASLTTDNTTDGVTISPTSIVRGGSIPYLSFYTDVGNGNGGTAGSHNRARFGVNITTTNIVGLHVGPITQGFNSATSTFGTQPISDSGSGTIITGGIDPQLNTLRKASNGTVELVGTGTPEGSRTALVGSTFRRIDGAAGTWLYIKETGSGNTGWVARL